MDLPADCHYDDTLYNYEPIIEKYRSIDEWPTSFTAPMRLDREHNQVIVLKDRLAITDDLVDDNTPLFDIHTDEAVRAFQKRHGLVVDGIVGPKTRAALNIPVSKKIEELENGKQLWANIPKCERAIIVNIPAYRLWAYDEFGTVQRTMKVIVGTPKDRTPVFDFDMSYIVFNPEWNIPRSIIPEKIETLQSAQRRGKLDVYLDKVPIVVYSNGKYINPRNVNWFNPPPISRMTEMPGPFNPLGLLKFMHYQKYNIYLHDTPSKQLFDYNKRMFSHGCIRVENYLELLDFVLQTNPMPQDEVDRIFDEKERNLVTLTNRIKVRVIYIRTWVDEEGRAHFSKDIYKKGY